MNLFSIAYKNLKRNFSFYSLYLFSVSFVLMILFCFTSFSLNEMIMEKISSDGRVEMMCRTVAVFLMAFVIFYMFYSNQFFLRRRLKELGIYLLLGYRKTSILLLLSVENIMVCGAGFLTAVITGSLLHKGITAGIIRLLGLTVEGSAPLIHPKAALLNLIFTAAVLAVLLLSNGLLLHRTSLLDLVRIERKKEKPLRIHPAAAAAGIFFLLAGYGLALDMIRGKESVWSRIGFSPVALVTILSVQPLLPEM